MIKIEVKKVHYKNGVTDILTYEVDDQHPKIRIEGNEYKFNTSLISRITHYPKR